MVRHMLAILMLLWCPQCNARHVDRGDACDKPAPARFHENLTSSEHNP